VYKENDAEVDIQKTTTIFAC